MHLIKDNNTERCPNAVLIFFMCFARPSRHPVVTNIKVVDRLQGIPHHTRQIYLSLTMKLVTYFKANGRFSERGRSRTGGELDVFFYELRAAEVLN
jgi:hypothetical protein